MIFEGNPFGWGFEEQSAITTLATQKKAKYSKPLEVKEQSDTLNDFFGQEFGHSPNIAHITEMSALDKEPYTNI